MLKINLVNGTVLLCLFINYVFCEYNLYGDAGQAYALQVNIGHPPQKVFHHLVYPNKEFPCLNVKPII